VTAARRPANARSPVLEKLVLKVLPLTAAASPAQMGHHEYTPTESSPGIRTDRSLTGCRGLGGGRRLVGGLLEVKSFLARVAGAEEDGYEDD
jgi:hypothetical protein